MMQTEPDEPRRPSLWRSLGALILILLPVAMASALLRRVRLDLAFCHSANVLEIERTPTPGFFSPDVLAGMTQPTLAITVIVALSFAGVTVMALGRRAPILGLLGWAGLVGVMVWLLADPSTLHGCSAGGDTGLDRLLLLLPAGWGYTLAVSSRMGKSKS